MLSARDTMCPAFSSIHYAALNGALLQLLDAALTPAISDVVASVALLLFYCCSILVLLLSYCCYCCCLAVPSAIAYRVLS